MGTDNGSWLHQPEPHGQCFNAESLRLPFDLGMQNASIPFAIPCTDVGHQNHAIPVFGYSELPNLQPVQPNEPHGRFYCLPHPRQDLISNMTLQRKILPNANNLGSVPTFIDENGGKANTGSAPKQFLVFDQTANKTTMMFSSGIGTQIQQLSSWSPKPTHYLNNHWLEFGIGSEEHHNSGPNLTDELDDYHVTNEKSEMREDSEEIDALLYSDDEGNYSDDAEEASTGHSPSSMTVHEKQDWFDEEDTDEVASSAGPHVKRQKVSDSTCEVPSVTNTTSSANPIRFIDYEDDAESSCAGGRPMGSLSGNKRLRNDKIRETVSILQTIIPGGKGKDAVMVLDEAIDYLQTLKFKAKILGLSAL